MCASFNGMIVKRDTALNDTMFSLGATVVRVMLSRNSRELVRLFSESAMIVGVLCLVAESPPVQVGSASFG